MVSTVGDGAPIREKLPNEIEFQLHSSYDDILLFGRYWPLPEEQTRAVILFFHGSGEHCQRYRHVAKFFNQKEFTCVGFDTRGHGLSEGERGFVPHVNASFRDLESVIKHIREKLNFKQPLVIYTHGTGGSICIAHALRETKTPLDCQYLILSTPSICLKTRPTALLYVVTRAFSNLSPNLRLPIQGNYTNEYCNDPVTVEAYRNDKLVHDRWPARTVSLYLEIGHSLESVTVTFPMPVLLEHGKDDTITPVAFIEKWFNERVKGEDKTMKIWSDHLHELHNDLGRNNVLQYGCDWITERLKAKASAASSTTAATATTSSV